MNFKQVLKKNYIEVHIPYKMWNFKSKYYDDVN